jgi:2,3-bisphosphoglycerate-independent phosphoglycerate mutase
MHILLIFLDGIGLGADDPTTNPFAAAQTPTLWTLANGQRWLAETGIQQSERAVFLPTDANLGLPGRPQSGTSQAAILTGLNLPEIIGRHYGPKPDAETRRILAEDNLFKQLIKAGKRAALLNAFPPHLLYDIERGKTLRTSIQLAAHEAGLPMHPASTLYSGDALSEDWTGLGWRRHLGFSDTPVYAPQEAGKRMVELSRRWDFSLFSHWMTDFTGHRGTLTQGVALLETFDGVMAGALETWNDDEGLIIITSDHGNLEALGDRKHTDNAVPTVVIGSQRHAFAEGFRSLMDITPRVLSLLTG